MTPAQLEHLKLIDAHLERLLEIASNRTPGEWDKTNYHHPDRQVVVRMGIGDNDAFPGDRKVCDIHHSSNSTDAAFIASAAGNAEAGWKATRAAIEFLLLQEELGEEFRFGHLLTDILAAFPLESIKP